MVSWPPPGRARTEGATSLQMQRGGRLTPAEISFEGKHWLLKFQLLPSFSAYSLQNHGRNLKIVQYRHNTKQLEMLWSADHVKYGTRVYAHTAQNTTVIFYPSLLQKRVKVTLTPVPQIWNLTCQTSECLLLIFQPILGWALEGTAWKGCHEAWRDWLST